MHKIKIGDQYNEEKDALELTRDIADTKRSINPRNVNAIRGGSLITSASRDTAPINSSKDSLANVKLGREFLTDFDNFVISKNAPVAVQIKAGIIIMLNTSIGVRILLLDFKLIQER